MTEKIKFRFLGGAGEVGRLGCVLEMRGKKLLLDYGFLPSKPPLYPEEAPPCDAAFISHAHLDHSGMMPWVSSHYDTPVFATSLTGTVAELLLNDSVNIARNEGYPEYYTQDDVEYLIENLRILNFKTKKNFDDILVRTYRAGHVPGATMYEFVTDRSVLFTGDINTKTTDLTEGAMPVECDVLFIESTYAGREHPDRTETAKKFVDKVKDAVKKGGQVLLPCFAVGRTQDVLMMLMDQGLDIWLDGMGKTVSEYYLQQPAFLSDPKKLEKALSQVKQVYSRKGFEKALDAEVIVTTSGMLDGGPILNYIAQKYNDPKTSVFLTGYQVQGTNGRLLMDMGMIEIAGHMQKVECKVEFFDFSAHAGHSELVEFIRKSNPQHVILMHGDNRTPLAEELKKDFHVVLPETNRVYEI
ncbi:MAG: MBL fold metallo-hydrolase [Thermoplasmata archaeon]